MQDIQLALIGYGLVPHPSYSEAKTEDRFDPYMSQVGRILLADLAADQVYDWDCIEDFVAWWRERSPSRLVGFEVPDFLGLVAVASKSLNVRDFWCQDVYEWLDPRGRSSVPLPEMLGRWGVQVDHNYVPGVNAEEDLAVVFRLACQRYSWDTQATQLAPSFPKMTEEEAA